MSDNSNDGCCLVNVFGCLFQIAVIVIACWVLWQYGGYILDFLMAVLGIAALALVGLIAAVLLAKLAFSVLHAMKPKPKPKQETEPKQVKPPKRVLLFSEKKLKPITEYHPKVKKSEDEEL